MSSNNIRPRPRENNIDQSGATRPITVLRAYQADFPGRLTATMARRGLLQAHLARGLRTSDYAVNRWRTGTAVPTAAWLFALADFLEVDARWLLLGEVAEAT